MQSWADKIFDKLTAKFARSAALVATQGLIPYKRENGRWIGSPFDGNSWWTWIMD